MFALFPITPTLENPHDFQARRGAPDPSKYSPVARDSIVTASAPSYYKHILPEYLLQEGNALKEGIDPLLIAKAAERLQDNSDYLLSLSKHCKGGRLFHSLGSNEPVITTHHLLEAMHSGLESGRLDQSQLLSSNSWLSRTIYKLYQSFITKEATNGLKYSIKELGSHEINEMLVLCELKIHVLYLRAHMFPLLQELEPPRSWLDLWRERFDHADKVLPAFLSMQRAAALGVRYESVPCGQDPAVRRRLRSARTTSTKTKHSTEPDGDAVMSDAPAILTTPASPRGGGIRKAAPKPRATSPTLSPPPSPRSRKPGLRVTNKPGRGSSPDQRKKSPSAERKYASHSIKKPATATFHAACAFADCPGTTSRAINLIGLDILRQYNIAGTIYEPIRAC